MTWKPKWHERNLERLQQLAPHTRAAAMRWYQFCINNRIDVYVTETIRTLERQKQLVASGASQTLRSYHLVGQAFDFVPIQNGQANYNLYKTEPFFRAVQYAKQLGFEWGGDWRSFVDAPHMQYNHRGYGTDTGNVPFTLPTLIPDFPSGVYYIQTGGYSGPALGEVHTYLFTTGHSFRVKRGADGSIVFLIGPFDTSAQNFRDCESFLRGNGHVYELQTPEKAAQWEAPRQAAPENLVFIETGGYAGKALVEVHTELFRVGYNFDAKRGIDGSIIFLVGVFDAATQDFRNFKAFLDRGGHIHKVIPGNAATDWK